MTYLYLVEFESDRDGTETAYPTLAAAKKARAQCDPGEGRTRRITVAKLPMRELLCALHNGIGFSVDSVEVLPAKRIPKDYDWIESGSYTSEG